MTKVGLKPAILMAYRHVDMLCTRIAILCYMNRMYDVVDYELSFSVLNYVTNNDTNSEYFLSQNY